jgi:hypothetical protein
VTGTDGADLHFGYFRADSRTKGKKLTWLQLAQGQGCFFADKAQFLGGSLAVDVQAGATDELVVTLGGSVFMELGKALRGKDGTVTAFTASSCQVDDAPIASDWPFSGAKTWASSMMTSTGCQRCFGALISASKNSFTKRLRSCCGSSYKSMMAETFSSRRRRASRLALRGSAGVSPFLPARI